MKLTFGQNIGSLRALSELSKTNTSLQRSNERLSSGLRINSASDDPAGLAIATSLRADSRLLTVASRNVNEGISALQVVGDALNELTNITTRIQELAIQAASGTYTNTERRALNEEAQALSDEFTRIVGTTKYNDQQLFAYNHGPLNIQVGSNGDPDSVISNDLGGKVSDLTYQDSTIVAVGNDAYIVATGDFNGDGKQDFVFTDQATSEVHFYTNDGDGQFTNVQTLSSGTRPRSASVSDFNNDGILDLVTANDLGDNVSVFLGNGDGTFSNATNLAAGNGVIGVDTGDLDGDGNIDLVVANRTDQNVAVFYGDGQGNFGAQEIIESGYDPYSIEVKDFNGDGIDDIAATRVEGLVQDEVKIILSNGDQTYQPSVAYQVGEFAAYLDSGDINNDGKLDIVTGDFTDNTISVLLGNGDGSFQNATTYSGLSTKLDDVKLGDMNGDGYDDVVASNFTGSSVSVFLGQADGSLSPLTTLGVGTSPNGVALTDVNNDGVLDILVGNNGSNDISLIIANTTSGLGAILPFSLETQAEAIQALSTIEDKQDLLAIHKGKIGANLSRLSIASQNLMTSQENHRAAADRIMSVDTAEEVANLVKNQILQQTQIAVLAHANLNSDLVLKLLK